MKRKFLIVLLALTLAIVSAFTLTACGETETHVHNYGVTWSDGGKKPTESEDGTANMTCIICGDSKTVTVPKLSDDTVWNLDEEIISTDCRTRGKRVYSSTAYGKVTVELARGKHRFGDLIPAVGLPGDETSMPEHYHCEVCGKNFAADGVTELVPSREPLEISIDLLPSAYSISGGISDKYIEFAVSVTNSENKNYTLTTDHDELVKMEGNKLYVIADTTKNVNVTVTAIAEADKTVTASKVITVIANVAEPAPDVKITVKTVNLETDMAKTTLRPGQTIKLVIEVINLTNSDKGYTVEVENPSFGKDLVTYDSRNNYITTDGTYTAVDENGATSKATLSDSVDVTITVTSTANPAVKESVTIRVKPSGLTSTMLRKIANPNITVSGTFTDVYGTTKTTYDYTIKMNSSEDEGGNVTAGAWSATWNKKGSQNVLSDNYKLGENDALIQAYIDKNNKIANKTVKDTNGIVLKWSEQHYWNHLDYFANNYKKFVYDDEVGAYRYNAEYGRYELDTNTWTNVYIPSEDEYHLKYIAWSMTPALEKQFYDFYVFLNADETAIDRIEGRTYPNPIYATDSDGNATEILTGYYYTSATMYFTEIGTTVVEDPKPYQIDTTQDYYKKLTEAIAKAKNMTNYSFAVVKTTMSAPSLNPDDYDIGGTTGGDTGSSGSASGQGVYDGTIKPYYYRSTSGVVGYLGVVTPDAILINETMKYESSLDDYVYRTDPYGYKQNSDGTYDEFEYDFDNRVLKGTRKRTGNIASVLPDFDISPAIFELTHTSVVNGTENEFIYTFALRDSEIGDSVARSLCLDDYAHFAIVDAENPFTIIVDENANITNVRFAYDIDGESGVYETVFTDFGTSKLPAGTFDNYEARVIPQKWSDFTKVRIYIFDGTTEPKEIYVDSATAIDIMFGAERAANVPAPTVFSKIFDDNLKGLWSDVLAAYRDANGDVKIHYALKIAATSDNVDENGKITDLEKKIDDLTLALSQLGFECDYGNSYGVAHSERYIVAFASEELGLQIKIENNNSGNFWITIYNYGDYKITK